MNIQVSGLIAGLLISSQCAAVNVGDITSIIEPNQSLLSKEIENTTDVARFVGLKIFRISSPLADGQLIEMQSKSEILSTPAGLVLPGFAKDIFKIIYQGPSDDKERYYRLSWIDAPVVSAGEDTANKGAQATTSAQINTILVVAPRQEKFDYHYTNGTINNTGNSSFRVVAAGKCLDESKNKDGNGCRERYYVMPGKSVTLQHIDINDGKTHLGIWHGSKYINVAR
ncbi:EcpB family pilus assembly chaperone [Acinetobacter stercoris]|uniref:Probable fimbrial chaperone EcpB n=1 Tax=Acinetobacter stercoris TaxID=2126983 RepID=A0A2U3N392_9GAMM|nr:hypothetical protein [Acinetobacter stercoris]SPL72084.1 hypothetical protein KPC_3262 [Acinetobacter stercoris]